MSDLVKAYKEKIIVDAENVYIPRDLFEEASKQEWKFGPLWNAVIEKEKEA